MRLYIVTANWGKGGPGGVAADLYRVVRKKGWECRFAYGRERVPIDINSYRIGNCVTPYLHAASSMVFDNAGFATKKPTLKLVEDIRRYQPDIINLHNPLGYSMNVSILFDYFKRSDIPVVWTMHDCWSVTGHCITGICENWKGGCGHCPNKKEYPASYVFDRSRRNLKRKQICFCDVPNLRLVSPSDWLKGLISSTYLKQYEIDVIPNGIDLSVFQPVKSVLRKKYHLQNKKVLLSVAGVWVKTKGARYLYKLADILGPEYVIVMVGKVHGKEWKRNSNRIIHIDHTKDRVQLAQWYSMADLFINPTMGDNFPTVNLEAMACGTPVVTFDTGGSGEAVGECGKIVPAGDIMKLKEAIFDCIEERIKPELCVNRARNYDKNIRYAQYLQLFEDILAAKQRG